MRKIKRTFQFIERLACPVDHSINLIFYKKPVAKCRLCHRIHKIDNLLRLKLLHNESGKCVEMPSQRTVFENGII